MSGPGDFESAGRTFAVPDGLTIRWLGTAGYELCAPEGVLYIDPYVTRAGLVSFLLRPLRPDPARIAAQIGRADAILVTHSHFDHALDVPTIAARTGAPVFGSPSTANLLQAAGTPSTQITALDPGKRTTFEVGPFRVTAVPSLHSPFALGGVPYPGDIPCTCDFPMRGSAYRCGDVFSFLVEHRGFRIYHLGSANLAEDAIPTTARGCDLLLLCIAARFATPGFVGRSLAALQPARIIPMHYDNFFRAADQPMWLLPRTSFGRFVDEVHAVSRRFEITTLPLTAERG